MCARLVKVDTAFALLRHVTWQSSKALMVSLDSMLKGTDDRLAMGVEISSDDLASATSESQSPGVPLDEWYGITTCVSEVQTELSLVPGTDYFFGWCVDQGKVDANQVTLSPGGADDGGGTSRSLVHGDTCAVVASNGLADSHYGATGGVRQSIRGTHRPDAADQQDHQQALVTH